jgi:hypothetical protein
MYLNVKNKGEREYIQVPVVRPKNEYKTREEVY